MKFEIRSRWSGEVLFALKTESLRLCVEAAAKSGSSLCGANLNGANLSGASLDGANLFGASLCGANLNGANLSGASLDGANLFGANLFGANLNGASLFGASLNRASLFGANLDGAKILFTKLPSIRTLSAINLGTLSDELSLELMRRDAAAHPHPERFQAWADGGDCPYVDEEYMWLFETRRNVYRTGPPQMTDLELIHAICKEKSWGIKG